MTSEALQVTPQEPAAIAHTLLGNQTWGLKTGGKIRPGTKVLTKAAEKNDRARAIYEVGMKNGLSFDEIERAITQAIPDLRNPLAMRNAPFFTIRRAELANPAIADQIMQLYAEDRGDGVRRLYRFPVIFPVDQWQLVVPHSLRAYTSGGLQYWSQYSNDGAQRYCTMFASPPTNGNGRVIRIFGGRKHVRRDDNSGLCDPENCPEYQTKRCNVDGRIIFWIPGVESLDPLEIPTRSFYGLSGVIEVLKRVAFARGGRISGFLNAQRQTFWISKSFESVPHVDAETGKPMRVDQWIIRLDAPVDVSRLLRAQDDDALQADGERAARMLNLVETESGNAEISGCAVTDESVLGESELIDGSVPPALTKIDTTLESLPDAQSRRAQAQPAASCALADLGALLSEIGIDVPLFERFAVKKWGAGWMKNPNGVLKATRLVQTHRQVPDAFVYKMEQELNVIAREGAKG